MNLKIIIIYFSKNIKINKKIGRNYVEYQNKQYYLLVF